MGVVTGGGGGGAGGLAVKSASLSLSSAQILALGNADLTLIAAQGANALIVVLSLVARYTFVATPYATETALWYGIGTTTGNFSARTSGFFGQTATKVTYMDPASALDGSSDTPGVCLNQPFVLGTGGNGNPTDGDSTASVTALYSVLTIA